MQTKKSQPLGQTWQTSFPALYVSPQVGISRSASKTNDRFYLTGCYSNFSCRYDYIDIYVQLKNLEENLLEAPVLGRFCGDSLDNLPRLIISTHNIIVIIFLSDQTKNDAGFEGTFAFIDACKYSLY